MQKVGNTEEMKPTVILSEAPDVSRERAADEANGRNASAETASGTAARVEQTTSLPYETPRYRLEDARIIRLLDDEGLDSEAGETKQVDSGKQSMADVESRPVEPTALNLKSSSTRLSKKVERPPMAVIQLTASKPAKRPDAPTAVFPQRRQSKAESFQSGSAVTPDVSATKRKDAARLGPSGLISSQSALTKMGNIPVTTKTTGFLPLLVRRAFHSIGCFGTDMVESKLTPTEFRTLRHLFYAIDVDSAGRGDGVWLCFLFDYSVVL